MLNEISRQEVIAPNKVLRTQSLVIIAAMVEIRAGTDPLLKLRSASVLCASAASSYTCVIAWVRNSYALATLGLLDCLNNTVVNASVHCNTGAHTYCILNALHPCIGSILCRSTPVLLQSCQAFLVCLTMEQHLNVTPLFLEWCLVSSSFAGGDN